MASLSYFAESLGPEPTSFVASNTGGLDRFVSLSGWPAPAAAGVLSHLLRQGELRGLESHSLLHPLDGSLQGVVFPQVSAGAYSFGPFDPQVRSALGLFPHPDLLGARARLAAARRTFSRAKAFHDSQEKLYGKHMDWRAADQATQELLRRLLGGRKQEGPGREVHRFFGAALPQGAVDCVPQLTQDLNCRVLLKGRPGTGKSTLLKKLARAAKEAGFAVELYHCSLDPKSLDLVVVRELSWCVLDSTAPHEYFPERPGDQVLDLYQRCVEPGTDQAWAGELSHLEDAYRSLVKAARGFLEEARESLEKFYQSLPQPDPAQLDQAKEELSAALLPR